MAEQPPPAFDPSRPPVIEGFTPTPMYQERQFDHLVRKCKENPAVPLGLFATAAAFTYGLISFQRGDSVRSQRMMRARVLAQGLTLSAIVLGMVFAGVSAKKGK
ncbi:hypothetical protein JRQ81_002728 [Phrynocephalus forsythii]|uniref:HIG1 domain-containing protein n=1 Tax=Phrynocephalus forsythii TaxID=171643 RepID=A0A9Q0XJ63_9SAUR|nr:hypothetical protein JRQ81_002728 [Phrynocephalus forsythii]